MGKCIICTYWRFSESLEPVIINAQEVYSEPTMNGLVTFEHHGIRMNKAGEFMLRMGADAGSRHYGGNFGVEKFHYSK